MDAMKWSSKKTFSFNLNLSLLACLLIMVFAIFSFSPTFAAEDKLGNSNNTVTQQLGVKSPATDLWRAVRQREFKGSEGFSSTTQARGLGADEFINIKGKEWSNFRMGQLVPYAAYLLGGVLLVLALFRLMRGKIKIKAGRSGKKILRFTPYQRFVHWSVAILFVILGITGLLLTFGKSGLIPIIGSKSFGTIAGFGKLLHDYLGPVFGILLVLMLFSFIKGNFGNWTDVKWFFKGGGMFGKHASAGRYNGGEKAWFWMAMLAGAVVVVSGVILSFPFFDQTREDLQLSHLVHAIGSVILLAASFGHIFMGTVAMEGSFETMKTGYCDENWAKEHHDLWYEDLAKQGLLGGSTNDMGGVALAGAGVVATGAMLKESSSNTLVEKSHANAQGLMGTSGNNTGVSQNTNKEAGKSTTKNKVKDTAKKSQTVSSSSVPDNLKKIEGIGPKIEELLKAADITTFSKLSQSQYDDLKAILNEAGSRYKMHNPTTWPQQAELADKGAWDELSDLQDRLLGGRE